MTRLSVLMPTCNGARFIEEQVRSILDQSFDSFELLIVDDGSTDATNEIVARLAREDPRIRILPAQGNRG